MTIEQPKKQAGPNIAKWFYAICPDCNRLLEVTDGRWPEHTYPPPYTVLRCHMGTKLHGARSPLDV